MSSPGSVDVCIVNYRGADDVREAVRTLGEWPHGTLWIVDNSEDAAQADALASIAGAQLLVPQKNLGFGRGCNLAFERSQADFFLLLNPDARIEAADLLRLADAMRADARLAALSPRIWWNPERSFLLPAAFPQTPWVTIAQTLAPGARGLTMKSSARYLARQRAMAASHATTPVDFIAGAVLLLRRGAVQEAGGLFDPAYFMFYEDSDLSLRLRRRGWRLGVTGAADAVHEYRHKAFKGALMMQAREVYFRKQYPGFWRATGGLRRLDAFVRQVPLAEWFDVLPRPCRTLDDFNEQSGSARIEAFSPSPLTMPAIFRPGAPAAFTREEWALLEPAGYAARIAGRTRWAWFERSATE
ncbi:glycosyltransferase [Ramlibacter albus]|uniref:Glycosyltransferase n=1 Tax=Ramlibacter albus TaxID=2079448 RepID=A0A923S1X8_9BURK|nr:glycosyltransferase [Ramlibacter albus]MBC5764751.1 glycosyltransferase [Ramlibacter albus]